MNIGEKNSARTMRGTDAILENLLDAVLVVDNQGHILYANRTAQDLFSHSASELKGQSFGFPIVPHETQEIQVFKAGRLLTVQMLASHIYWEEQMASLLSLRDITTQKEAQEELAKQREVLEKTNEENEQYASLASHDLKEPIRKILFFSDQLLSGQQLAEKERVYIEKIHSSAKRMHSLVTGISELSKITHTKHAFKPVNLNLVVKEVVNDLELQIEEKHANIEVSALPTIDALQNEMYQLFFNLVSNALKYSRDDIPSHIRIRERDAEDGCVCIECSDNGIGFDDEMSLKLFKPFQRLHSTKYDGMGIGLTLCQKIIKVHHGKITAHGVRGKGATFRILLPRQQSNDD
ncbi:MAG TPA: ATP-binding protein [Flavisolibacter sp.]